MQKGKFIVIEGLEGAGKTTALTVIKRTLEEQGIINLAFTREPGGTPLAEKLRKLWKEGYQEDYATNKVEVLMLYAARVQLFETLIQPALNRGTWVIGDRHDMSTQAYQGGGRGLNSLFLHTIKQSVLGDFHPDLTLYLDVDPEVGLKRASQRGKLDRIEQQDLDFFKRTRQRYLELVDIHPNVIKIDANQPIEVVSTDIAQKLSAWLKDVA